MNIENRRQLENTRVKLQELEQLFTKTQTGPAASGLSSGFLYLRSRILGRAEQLLGADFQAGQEEGVIDHAGEDDDLFPDIAGALQDHDRAVLVGEMLSTFR